MEKKIVGILVCTLLLAATVLPVAGTKIVIEDEVSSSGLAPITDSFELEGAQWKNVEEGLTDRATPFYGYIPYDPSGVLPVGPCSFLPTTPGVITSLLPTSSTDFISGGTWALGKWYGCEYALGGGLPLIWTISTAGVMTPIGSYDPGGTGLSFNGLAYDQTTGLMYGCSSTDLYTIDINTGASTLIGNFGISGGIMIAIAFDGSGNLYGTELINDYLYSINPANAATTPIGNGLGINLNYAQDMAFDIDTNTLYLSAFTIAPLFEGALYTCNTVTGVPTKVGTFQGGAEVTGFAIPYCGILKINVASMAGGITQIGQSRIKFDINNIGGLPCTNVDVNLDSSGGFVIILGSIPTIASILPGVPVTVKTPPIFGIGLPTTFTIVVTETACGSTDTQTKNGVVFGPLWWL
jgi:hypothetical protein